MVFDRSNKPDFTMKRTSDLEKAFGVIKPEHYSYNGVDE